MPIDLAPAQMGVHQALRRITRKKLYCRPGVVFDSEPGIYCSTCSKIFNRPSHTRESPRRNLEEGSPPPTNGLNLKKPPRLGSVVLQHLAGNQGSEGRQWNGNNSRFGFLVPEKAGATGLVWVFALLASRGRSRSTL